MRIRWRDWGVTALAWIAVLGLAGMALAGGETGEAPTGALVQAQAEDEGPSAEGADGEGHAVENHGRCVSAWVHRAKDAGLKGRAKGAFVSSIAQQEEAVAPKDDPGEACDFADELETALTEQGTQTEQAAGEADEPRGKSGEAPGKNKLADAGSDEESTPEPDESPDEEVEVPLETDVSGDVEG